MEKVEIRRLLKKANPRAPSAKIEIVAALCALYLEAAKNVEANGAIVAHPRTSAPMENPYLSILEKQGRALFALRGINVDAVIVAPKEAP